MHFSTQRAPRHLTAKDTVPETSRQIPRPISFVYPFAGKICSLHVVYRVVETTAQIRFSFSLQPENFSPGLLQL